jgi:hypothetical protein
VTWIFFFFFFFFFLGGFVNVIFWVLLRIGADRQRYYLGICS